MLPPDERGTTRDPAPLEETRPDGHGRARGLVSSRESGRRVEARTFAPPPALAPFVEYFWVTRWDLRDQPPHVAELLGDPCVHLACEAGDNRVVGVSTRLWKRSLAGAGVIRAAKLRAGSAGAFLALPIARLTDRVVPLGTELPAFDADVEAAVLGPADDREGFGALGEFLERCVRDPLDERLGLAVKILEHIARHEELTSAAAAAAQAGYSLRPLQKLFRELVGAPPKWVIRRHRLQEAALRLERGGVVSLADLALELGYSDHAHLSRDFKAATGRSPSVFARDVAK